MKVKQKKSILLENYQKPIYLISEVNLTFELDLERTLVHAKIHFYKEILKQENEPLILNGRNLQLLDIKVDGNVLDDKFYKIDEDSLTIFNLPNSFILQTTCAINPKENTELYGVYQSNGFICSHNEPEGFRNITYFLDRPDVMAKFKTTLKGSKELFPVLLSNGNLVEKKDLPNGMHQVTWEDPFKKPCYLFALVAGKLDVLHDVYVTKSKKKIDLSFYTEPGQIKRVQFAMECLKNAMRFDEEVFGLEYDLSCYMIVAVDFFNMGAMENKGLNIFNTSTCFADSKTATDDNFLRVETVIGHEYFHNWSGNRIGVRDWFQLTLKEGLTVFRDQEFTCYLHDRTVKRIEDVIKLRARQFPEDQGPTAHPIQPKQYIEINNFYTPTIYDKGAEVVRMLKTLLGETVFFKGVKIFFEKYDGTAATIENWLHSMEVASGRNLDQFNRWYHQYGTPIVKVEYKYDKNNQTMTLNVKQEAHHNHSSQEFKPYLFPLKIGLVDLNGSSISFNLENSEVLDEAILEIKQYDQKFILKNVLKECIPSVNREFSAPIQLQIDMSFNDLAILASSDSDLFNRFEFFQRLTIELMQEQVVNYESNRPIECDRRFLQLFSRILNDNNISFALKAKILKLPEENDLALTQKIMSCQGNYYIKKFFGQEIAKNFEKELLSIYLKLKSENQYNFDTNEIGKRKLKNLCLSYLSFLETKEVVSILENQFLKAIHMTDEFAALEMLSQIRCPERDSALDNFYEKYKEDSLTLVKWLAVQSGSKLDETIASLKKLVNSPRFQWKMPNHIRGIFMILAENTSIFHALNEEGYEFYFSAIAKVDVFNPQTAAMMAQSLKRINQLNHKQKSIFKKCLENLFDKYELSPNVLEILTKIHKSC